MHNRKFHGFSLVEIIVAIALVGTLLTMIGGVVVVLDRSVANERIIQLPPARVSDANLASYGYTQRPNYALAPSRVMEAKADALWRQAQVMYEESYAVTAVDGYILHTFTGQPRFVGNVGRLSAVGDPLLPSELADMGTMDGILRSRFTPPNFGTTAYELWTPPAGVDASSYRSATIFFLAAEDRLLGMLRVRCYQFRDTADPYRYYDVSLSRLVWARAGAAPNFTYSLQLPGPNFFEDFTYNFVEDRRHPQSLLRPFTRAATAMGASEEYDVEQNSNNWAAGKNLVIRAALPGESVDLSRRQVAYVGTAWNLPVVVNEWHVNLPDPGLSQGEDRARIIRKNPRGDPDFNVTLYNSLRRQGRFACVFKVLP